MCEDPPDIHVSRICKLWAHNRQREYDVVKLTRWGHGITVDSARNKKLESMMHAFRENVLLL